MDMRRDGLSVPENRDEGVCWSLWIGRMIHQPPSCRGCMQPPETVLRKYLLRSLLSSRIQALDRSAGLSRMDKLAPHQSGQRRSEHAHCKVCCRWQNIP